jgi:hypothetical protein
MSLWDALFIQVLDRTGPLMLNLSGTPYIWDFSMKRSIAQRRSYGCDGTSMRQADQDISHLFTKFFPSSDENRSYPSRELFAILCCLCLNMDIFDFFHIQKLYVFASTL